MSSTVLCLLVLSALDAVVHHSVVRAYTFSEVTSEAGITVPEVGKVCRAAVGDLNQDGYLDLVQTNHARRPVDVFYGQPSGVFHREAAFIPRTDRHGSSIGDYNNDGLPDIVMVNGRIISRKKPDGTRYGQAKQAPTLGRTLSGVIGDFEEIPGEDVGLAPGVEQGIGARFGARMLDVDNDGDLDMFLHAFKVSTKTGTRSLYNDTRHNVLYRNNGRGEFEFVPNTGIERGQDLGFLVTDFDMDGFPDIIVYRQGLTIFRNNGDFTFSDATVSVTRKKFKRISISSAVEFDYDNDGDMDIYFTGGFKLKRGVTFDNDIMLENNGDGTFTDVSLASRIPRGGSHMGVTTGDFNNNGFMDLFLSRVGPTNERISDLVLINNGDKTFSAIEDHGANGPLDGTDVTSGVGGQAFDYNKDGLIDLVVTARKWPDAGKLRLFKNITPLPGNFVIVNVPVKLFGRTTVDATVRVFTSSGTFTRRVGSAGEMRVQSFIDQVHVGIGEATSINHISVTLTNGARAVIQKPPVNQEIFVSIMEECNGRQDYFVNFGAIQASAPFAKWNTNNIAPGGSEMVAGSRGSVSLPREYQSVVYFPVTASYTLTAANNSVACSLELGFTETYFSRAGQRSFSVRVSGAEEHRLLDIDVLARVGKDQPYAIRIPEIRPNPDGSIAVEFIVGAANFPIISVLNLCCS